MPRAPLRLRLLATSDLHMQITTPRGADGRPDPGAGLLRLAGLIARARAEATTQGRLVLLLDNGDGMQGNLLGDLAAEEDAGPHPLMRAFAHLGYDTLGLGNHDFDFGPEALARAIRAAPCPVLCANLRPLTGDQTLAALQSHVVLQRQAPGGEPLRIGLFSVLPPQTAQWNRPRLAGRFGFDDMVQVAKREVAALRDQGCDLVIALAHTGPGPDHAIAGMENALRPIAALPGLDAVIGGHTHEARVLADPGAAPAVLPGFAGSHLGVIDLDRPANGPLRSRAELRTLASTLPMAEDADLKALLTPDLAAAQQAMTEPAGHAARPLHSYFSFIAPDRSLAIIAAAQAAALRPLLAAGPAAGLPVLSAAAPAKYGMRSGPRHYTDIAAGPMTRLDLSDLYPFPNALNAVIVTGAQIADWLESAASLFCQLTPGARADALTDPAMPGHGFDVLHGLSYRFDLTAAARYDPDGALRPDGDTRLRDLRHEGRPVLPGDRFVVALNSYRAAGGGQVAALRAAEPLPLPPLQIRDCLRRYLSGQLPADPLEHSQPWGFSPLPAGTAAQVLTGPGAQAHLAELQGRGIRPEGFSEDGFLRLHLPLDRP